MNDHNAEAEQAIVAAYNSLPPSNLVFATLAQVHATLYLAEQQRVANLIALTTLMGETRGSEDELKQFLKQKLDLITTLTETEKP
jgi:hypothetical protein